MEKWRRNSGGFSTKSEASRKIDIVGEVLKGYKGQCLFPADDGELCSSPPSKRHVIPESSVLGKLKNEKSGMVMEFGWGVGQWKNLWLKSDAEHPVYLNNPATFKPREVGTGDACTGLFACQRHDQVFNPCLDTDKPDFKDPYVRLLAIGRAVLYAADLASKGKLLADTWNSRGKRAAEKRLRKSWKNKRKLALTAYRQAHLAAEKWRKIWQSAVRESQLPEDVVDWCQLTLRSTLTFAACVFYGQGSVVMVLPVDGESHKMTILYYKEDSESVKEDKERLAQKASDTEESDAGGVSIVSELMSNGRGVIAASPTSYEGLRNEDKLAIQRIMMENLRFWEDSTKAHI